MCHPELTVFSESPSSCAAKVRNDMTGDFYEFNKKASTFILA